MDLVSQCFFVLDDLLGFRGSVWNVVAEVDFGTSAIGFGLAFLFKERQARGLPLCIGPFPKLDGMVRWFGENFGVAGRLLWFRNPRGFLSKFASALAFASTFFWTIPYPMILTTTIVTATVCAFPAALAT